MLYLIRHEETPLNAEGKFRGSSNPGLTQRGKHAATGTGYRMDGKFDRIVTDGYARTQQTAERIARGVPVEHDEGLSPWNIGDWSGTPKNERTERQFNAQHVAKPGNAPSGGESLNSFLARWKPVYDGYLQQSKKQNIALVTHGSNIGAVLSKFKPAPIQGAATVRKPGAIVKVSPDGTPNIMETGRSPHSAPRSAPSAPTMKLAGLARA